MAKLTQKVLALLGDLESASDLAIPASFSARDSVNVYADKFGDVRRVLGYKSKGVFSGGTAHHAVGMGTWLDGSSSHILAAFDDGSGAYRIARSTDFGLTWAEQEDLGSGPVGNRPSFAQMLGSTYIAVGSGTPRVYDGTGSQAVSETQSPTPTLSDGGAGNLVGTIRCKIVSVEADGTRHPASVRDTIQPTTGRAIDVSWSADADPDVTGYEVYRTSGTGEIYRLEGFTTSTSFTLNMTDVELVTKRRLEVHGDPPPDDVRYAVPYGNRMHWLGTPANPRRGWYSDFRKPGSVGDNSFLDYEDSQGGSDRITAGFGGFQDSLIVFLEFSIYRVAGTGAVLNNVVQFQQTPTNASVGAVPDCPIIEVPAGAVYIDDTGELQQTTRATLAYVTPYLDIRLFDGDNDVMISGPKRDFLQDVNSSATAKIRAVRDDINGQIAWFVPHGHGTTEPNKAVVWNWRHGIWSHIDSAPFSAAVSIQGTDEAQLMFTGSNSTDDDGVVYEWFRGNSFDGSAIQGEYWSPPLYGAGRGGENLHERTKGANWISVNRRAPSADLAHLKTSDDEFILTSDGEKILLGQPASDLTLEVYEGAGGPDDTPFFTSTLADDSTVAETIEELVLLRASDGRRPRGKSFRVRIYSNDANDESPWALNGYTWSFDVYPDARKRSR